MIYQKNLFHFCDLVVQYQSWQANSHTEPAAPGLKGNHHEHDNSIKHRRKIDCSPQSIPGGEGWARTAPSRQVRHFDHRPDGSLHVGGGCPEADRQHLWICRCRHDGWSSEPSYAGTKRDRKHLAALLTPPPSLACGVCQLSYHPPTPQGIIMRKSP